MLRLDLNYDEEFVAIYNKFNTSESGKEYLRSFGISRKKLDIADMSKLYFSDTDENISTDMNSNIGRTNKSNSHYMGIIFKALSKLNSLFLLWKNLKITYGSDKARDCIEKIITGSVYFHDIYTTQNYYCLAISTSNIMNSGRPYGQLHSLPCRRSDSYIAVVTETMFDMSMEQAGALSVPDYICNLCYYYVKEGIDPIKDKYKIENDFQRFIHSLNQTFRISQESLFSNISIFDRPTIEETFKDYRYPDGSSPLDILEYIMQVQYIFMEIMAKKDPTTGMPIRFPVCFPGNESLILNNKIVKFKEVFNNYDLGWTNVEDKMLYTLDNFKPVKIKNVFVGESDRFIKLLSPVCKDIEITPDHKFLMDDNTLKAAKDIQIGDKIKLDNYDLKEEDSKKYIIIDEYLDDLWVLGYKMKYSVLKEETELLNNNRLDGYNHHMSHPLYLIDRYKEHCYKFPEIELCKTKDSKQKGAIKRKIDLDYDFGYFIGVSFAEGHNSSGEMGISINKKEEFMRDSVINFLRNKLLLKSEIHVREFEGTDGIQIVFYSKTLGDLMDIFIGRYARGVTLNLELILNTPNEFRWGILNGILDGDGHAIERSIGITTTSKKGVESIQLLATSLGILSKYKKLPNDRGYSKNHDNFSYLIIFNRKNIYDNIYMNSNNMGYKLFLNKDRNFRYLKEHKYFIVTGKEEILKPVKEKVYNIEVDNNDHIFSLPCGIRTSNCTLNINLNIDNNIIDNEFLENVCKYNTEGIFNIFLTRGKGRLASCCRLLSDPVKLMEFARFDSFGNSGINIGSLRVVTVNFARIGRQAKKDKDKYFEILSERLEDARKLLLTHRNIIKERIDQGFLRFFKLGWINMNMFFSTFGLSGLYESLEYMGYDIRNKDGLDFASDILLFLEKKLTEFSNDDKVPYNLEQIPGESAASTLAKLDKIFFNDDNYPYEIYGNQFIPLWIQSDVVERATIDGALCKKMSGGAITHLNLGSKATPEQMKDLINLAIDKNLEHFACNTVFMSCVNGHVNLGKSTDNKCPVCGDEITNKVTRVVGYWTPVNDWDKVRREIDFPNRQFNYLDSLQKEDNISNTNQ